MLSIVKIKGGLGNQMFQYAFFLALKRRHPFSLFLFDLEESLYCHSGYQLDKVTHAHTLKSGRWYVRINKHFPKILKQFRKINQTNSLEYKEKYLKHTFIPTRYDGYWQSEKYFLYIANKVRRSFQFRENLLNEQSKKLASYINGNEFVSIHIRRGDYTNLTDYFGLCDIEYYKKAINYIQKHTSSPKFIFFSDDIPWVKDNLKNDDAIYVDWNQGKDCWQDMYLMSLCKHNIIANSSFSWWGAWLNNNPQKIVIAPEKWFKFSPNYDIIPNGWITI